MNDKWTELPMDGRHCEQTLGCWRAAGKEGGGHWRLMASTALIHCKKASETHHLPRGRWENECCIES